MTLAPARDPKQCGGRLNDWCVFSEHELSKYVQDTDS